MNKTYKSTVVKMAIIFALFYVANCQGSNQDRILTLEKKVAQLSNQKPGLGEIMSGIQMHHAKLYFAGVAKNWPLAKYEIEELQERFDEAREFHPFFKKADVQLTPLLALMDPPIANASTAVAEKDESKFKNSFKQITKACNDCHKATKFSFNKVIVPKALPVTNQDFSF